LKVYHYSAMTKEGDHFPDATLFGKNPGDAVNLTALLTGRRVILFGVPGAFTPGCQKSHLPGYLANYEKFKEKGIDEIICISVNDPFVMSAWGEHMHCEGKVTMLSDPRGELTKHLGLELDATGALGNVRCRRFSALIEDRVVKILNAEAGGELTCSLAEPILGRL